MALELAVEFDGLRDDAAYLRFSAMRWDKDPQEESDRTFVELRTYTSKEAADKNSKFYVRSDFILTRKESQELSDVLLKQLYAFAKAREEYRKARDV